MVNVGEIQRAKELGYSGRGLHIYSSCPSCGKLRWVPLSKSGILCQLCAAQRRAREQTPVIYSGDGEPKLGDTASARTLGYVGNGIYVYDACPKCGRVRWVRRLSKGTLCVHCVPKLKGQRHPSWSGGHKTKRGYIYVLINKDDPMFSMSRNGWILEHRLVAARQIGRVLKKGEVVHHINGVKSDNRPSNLLVLMTRKHNSHMVTKDLQSQIQNLETRVTLLEAENTLLLSEIRDSTPDYNLKLQCYNTPSNCSDGTIEGIVQALSNEGEEIELV